VALLEPGEGATTSHTYAPTTELRHQIDALDNLQSFAYTVAAERKNARLTLSGDDQRERTLVSDLHYNAAGQIVSQTASNGVVTRHCYDSADGRLTRLSAHKTNGTPLQDLKYRYDAVGNVMSIEDAAQPIRYFNNQRIEPIKTYRYDTLNQLIEATGWEARTGHGGPALPGLQPCPSTPNRLPITARRITTTPAVTGFRYYAPWLQRWINPDPAWGIDGLNFYRMVRNNPIALHDPNGLTPHGDLARTIMASKGFQEKYYENPEIALSIMAEIAKKDKHPADVIERAIRRVRKEMSPPLEDATAQMGSLAIAIPKKKFANHRKNINTCLNSRRSMQQPKVQTKLTLQ
jgi:YD repeat-containing protein